MIFCSFIAVNLKLKVMKRLFYLWSVILCLFSCQQNEQIENEGGQEPISTRASKSDFQDAAELNLNITDYFKMNDAVKSMRRASITMSQYINLDKINRRYTVDISESKALELGVDKANYDRIVSEIDNLNKALVDNPDIELMDLRQQYKDYREKLDSGFLLDRVMNDSEVDVCGPNSTSGIIITNGNDFGKDAFYPAYGVCAVRFICRPVASVVTLCTCKTEVSGEWNTKSGMASIFYSVTLDVGIAYSGSSVCAVLYFGTMDSNGGTADWQILMC